VRHRQQRLQIFVKFCAHHQRHNSWNVSKPSYLLWFIRV
jgi:hypothetical protein